MASLDRAPVRSRLRLRRMRRLAAVRRWTAGPTVDVERLMWPIFVRPGAGAPEPVAALPGVERYSVGRVDRLARTIQSEGLRSVLVFGVPRRKDDLGSGAVAPNGLVPQAIRAIKRAAPDLVVATDVCLCAYTRYGHCGVVRGREVDNDRTVEQLARMAVAHARAGADFVAPSAMMDHQVGAIRDALDRAGHTSTGILAYAAKFASAFYGPFREAADSAPAWGDRRGYQLPPDHLRAALEEMAEDAAEGADVLMVKPGLPYLDVLARARERFDRPLAAYQVSGEYAMLKAAARAGALDERAAVDESIVALHRAGADLIVSYFAREIAQRRGR